ncbi:MAG: tetratricopeptide repeat protein [Bacteroidota bacterium]
MSSSRQLAAIMFTDIVGYTALMGNDEKHAFTLLNKNRQLQKPIIGEFDGRWIKEIGDGTMASFNTVSDAVNAAIKIQEACNAANDFQLRIGIHQGEVVFENDDVFGDSVNIAARVQAAAAPGCIFITETVHHNISNKSEIKSQFVKEEKLKNVSQPVRMYQVLFAGSEIIVPEKPQATIIEKCIAVLPFVNMSNDPDQEFFSDGISEEIINMLAQVLELKVIGRTSSFAFKGKNLDLRLIGEQLKTTHILEGSVRKSGNKLRITAQLIDVVDGTHLYSEKFDRELEDVFDIQDEIAEAILKAVKIKLLDEEKVDVFKKYTDNIEAYQLFLKGRYHLNKFSPDNFLKAIEYYQSAINLDPNYAIAYAEMGICYYDQAYFNWAPWAESTPKAITAINKAFTLDSENDICLVAMGSRVLLWYNWEFNEAARYLKKAIQINPNNVEGHRQLGVLNMLQGNYGESFKYYEKAEALDPFSLLGLLYHGCHYAIGGLFGRTLEYGNRLIAIEPHFFGGYFTLGAGYLYLKQYDKAVEAMETAVNLNPDLADFCFLGSAYAGNGERRKVEEILAKMEALTFPNEGNTWFGRVYLMMKDWDKAFDYFTKAVKKREGDSLLIPRFILSLAPEMRNDPRTIELLKMIGLPN